MQHPVPTCCPAGAELVSKSWGRTRRCHGMPFTPVKQQIKQPALGKCEGMSSAHGYHRPFSPHPLHKQTLSVVAHVIRCLALSFGVLLVCVHLADPLLSYKQLGRGRLCFF